MSALLIACVLIMAASLVGVVSVWSRAGEAIERKLDFLTSFSAGVFLIVAYHLAQETVEHSETVGAGLLWLIIGALATWLLFKLLPALHTHAKGHEHEGHTIDPRRLLLSDALHNIGDGIVLAASFMVSTALGAAAAVSIFVHEVVQEISEFFILREAGLTTRQALTLNLTVSSTILIGAVGAYFLLDFFELIEGPLLGFSAGAFLIVVLGDLIPHSLRATHGRSHVWAHLLWFGTGAFIMFLVSSFGH